MNQKREKEILEILLREKSVQVKDLAARLFASEPSIRRDLSSLEKQQLIKRTHGGAMLEENSQSVNKIPFLLRELEHADEKMIIAQKAAKLVCDGDVIFLDGSTSACRLVPFLASKSRITVITSGIRALLELSEYGIPVISTGGTSINSCLSLVGSDALRTIRSYNAEICFFSCRGLDDEGNLTDISIEEDVVRQEMIAHSRRSYALCSSTRLGKRYIHNLCHIRDITGVIRADGE